MEELAAVIAGNAEHRSKFHGKNRTDTGSRQTQNSQRMSFLIDIQEKMREGKGRGYVTWAKNFNLKQRAEAMLFMREHKIESFEELVRRADEASGQAEASADTATLLKLLQNPEMAALLKTLAKSL